MSERIFTRIMKRAAEAEKVEPHQITRFLFRRHRKQNELSDNKIQELGGYTYLKENLFPPPPGPFDIEGIEQWSTQQFSDYVGDIIAEAAEKKYADTPPHLITWDQFARYIKLRWGVSEKKIPKYLITQAGGYNNIRDSQFPIEPTEMTMQKRLIHVTARENRQRGLLAADKQYLFDRIKDWTADLYQNFIPAPVVPLSVDTEHEQTLNIIISDTHIGSDIDVKETGVMSFGVIEESRRLASIAKQLVQTVPNAKKVRLKIWLIGDIIQNQLHDTSDGAPLAKQFVRAVCLLSQFINFLAHHFLSVDVECATGNHGRFKERHKERAIHEKWNSIETAIYYSVYNACLNLDNVRFTIPETPYVVAANYGVKIFGTHGDTVTKVGNPYKAIYVESLELQALRFNANRQDAEKFRVFVMGHIHMFSAQHVSSDFRFITNYPLVPADPYSISIGQMNTQCGQVAFESRPGNPVVAIYPLLVGQKDDADESLDEIIRPWPGFPQQTA